MSLKELNCFSFINNNWPTNHCLTSTQHNLEFCLNNRSAAEVVKIRFDHSDEDTLNIFQSIDIPSPMRPTEHLCADPTALYNVSSTSQKQQLTLDPLLLPEITSDIENNFVGVELAPNNGSRTSYLASLTNFGHCIIKRKEMHVHKWTETVGDLSAVWKTHFQRVLDADSNLAFDTFCQQSHGIQLTAFDWATTNQSEDATSLSMVCMSAAGHCIFFNIPLETGIITQPTIVHVTDLQQTTRINRIKWISIGTLGSFLCTANVLGQVHLYRLVCNQTTNQATGVELCASLIELQIICSIERLELEYDAKSNQLIVLICMGSRIVVVYVPVADVNAFTVVHHSMDHDVITGITKISPLTYGLCSLHGVIQKIQISASNQRLTFETITTNINMDKYKMLGIAVTANEALWLFAIYPRQPFDHLAIRYPVQLSICSPSSLALWSCVQSRPSNAVDCLEALRVNQMRYDDLVDYPNMLTDFTQDLSDDALVDQLRLRHDLLATSLSCVRRKSNPNDLPELIDEAEFVKRTILAINYYRRLAQTTSSPIHSPMLYLSCKHMISFLSKYIVAKSHPNYGLLTTNICPQISMALQMLEVESASRLNDCHEYCHHCDAALEHGSDECVNGHKITRCCITCLQIPVISNRSCLQCGALALDLETLSELHTKDDSLQMCPVCNVKFVTSQYF